MAAIIKLEKTKESDRYNVFSNTETTEDKDGRGNPVPKTVVASRTVYIHKSASNGEDAYMLVPKTVFDAMQKAVEGSKAEVAVAGAQRGRKR